VSCVGEVRSLVSTKSTGQAEPDPGWVLIPMSFWWIIIGQFIHGFTVPLT
jgi:hypothetical protein